MCERREIAAGETRLAWRAMRELRPDLASDEELVARVDDQQRAEGYRLLGCFVDGEDEAVAVAGFRVGHSLADGHYLYVDDLVTQETFRGQGHAGHLMDWVRQEALRLGCAHLQLDSAVGPERQAAHRFYFANGMRITAYHFGVDLSHAT
jgi:GNAT superfamily N-acetyltransferase